MWPWLGTFFVILGGRQLAHKKRDGWVCLICADICWTIVGFNVGDMNIVCAQAALFFVHIYGICKWRKKSDTRTTP